LDGTLIDSAADIANALNQALAKRELPGFPVDKVKEMIGGGVSKLVERALLAHGVSRIGLMPLVSDFMQFYRENLTTHTALYEGARELLERLKDEGRQLGLCTNKQHSLTVETLNQLGIAKYFSAVIGERTGHPRKPDPTPLRGVLTAVGVAPERAVMVGDSAADVGCARAAGVPVVAVSFGYSRIAAESLGSDAVIERLEDLPRCFARLQRRKEPV
ncbi:MAG: phosphoglycolate phosphatase, partial [Rhodomicrobium sp.]|nr:phosphoglycolate phosphatase [Rhodomicrobium sp.]